MWWCSSLLDIVLTILVLLYECFLQRLTNMEFDINKSAPKKVTEFEKDVIEDNLDGLNKDNNLESNISNYYLESTISNNNLESTTLNNNLENTTSDDNFESAISNNSLNSTTSNNKLESITSDNNLENLIFDTDNLENTKVYIERATLNRILTLNVNTDSGGNGEKVLKDVIKIPDLFLKGKLSKMYEVNGSTFIDNDRMSSHDDDTVVNYELYKCEKQTMDAEDENGDDDLTTELDIHVQTLPHGVIINSNVFLWHTHWHTMTLMDANIFCCAVCRVYCDRVGVDRHVETAGHLRNVNEFRPLKRFDLSIIRKINENFHCGVCNVIFDMIDYKIHESSKTHEGNLLTAINKVSDLMYDSNIHKNIPIEKISQNLNRSIQNYGSYSQNYDTSMMNRDRDTMNRDRDIQNRDRDIESRNNNNEFHFDANAINNNNYQVYEEFSSDEEEEEEEEDEDEEFEEYSTPFQGVSYASMASKPTINLPKFLKIDLGTKEVRVKLESWHMVVKIELNKFYCMVCNKTEHIRFKSQHCISCEHVEKLTKCTVVKAFEDYLIRKVDDKLYHCGHCNNLQYQDQIFDHIESAHPKKNKNIIDTTASNSPLKITKKSTKNIDKNTPTNSNHKTSEKSIDIEKNADNKNIPSNQKTSEQQNVNSPNIDFKIEPRIDPNFDIFGDLIVSPFGTELKISALAFNFIKEREDGYYCAICDKICEDVRVHVGNMEHVELMTMTPFIRPFKCNLTRAVKSTLHCSLCNVLMPVSEMYTHNIDPPHTDALAKALGMTKSQKPDTRKMLKPIQDFEYTQKLSLTQNLDQNVPKLSPLPDPSKSPKPILSNQGDQKVPVFGSLAPKLQNTAINTEVTNSSSDVLNISTQNNSNTPISLFSPNQEIIKKNDSSNSSKTVPKGAQFNFNSGVNFNSGSISPNLGPNHSNLAQYHLNPAQNHPNPAQNHFNLPQNHPNSAQNHPNHAQNHPDLGQNNSNLTQNHPNPAQNHSNLSQNHPNPGQNHLNLAQVHLNSAQNHPNFVQFHPNLENHPTPPQNMPCPGQNHPNVPPIYNAMFPILHSQNMNQYLANLMYGPEAIYPIPVGPMATLSPNFTNQNVSAKQTDKSSTNNQNGKSNLDTKYNAKIRKNSLTNDKENTKFGNEIGKCGNNVLKSGNYVLKSGNIIKSGNDTIESVTSQSDDDELRLFNEEEMVFIKFKTAYFKLTNLSYNTLVYLDNGLRYCFVCSVTISSAVLCRHVESREHAENVAKNKFLDKYGVQLFRQMYLMYHCAICNELMTRKEIKLHLDWSLHIESYDSSHIKLNKKNRKQLKSGIKEYIIETQREAIYHNVNEPKINLVAAYQIVHSMEAEKDDLNLTPTKKSNCSKPTATKKNKMIIMNNVVMKVGFDQWHGITSAKNFTKCILCQLEIKENEVFEHIETEYHIVALGKTFERSYYPALVRKINEKTVNCMICNLELPNDDYLVFEHTNGRKHNKNQSRIVNESSNSDSYADCYEDYLNL